MNCGIYKITNIVNNKRKRMTGNTHWLGKNHSEETKHKLSEGRKGKPAHNKGLPMGDEQKQKLSISKKLYHLNKRNEKEILSVWGCL